MRDGSKKALLAWASARAASFNGERSGVDVEDEDGIRERNEMEDRTEERTEGPIRI